MRNIARRNPKWVEYLHLNVLEADMDDSQEVAEAANAEALNVRLRLRSGLVFP